MGRVRSDEEKARNRERMRAARAADPEKYREINRRYAERNREKLRASNRVANLSPERIAKRDEDNRRYREANREKLAAYQADYYAKNKERKIKVINDARRARRAADPNLNARENRVRKLTDLGFSYSEILLFDPCCYCGEPVEHIDHIVPVASGGSNDWDNLTGACASCNTSKGARPMLHFVISKLAQPE